jgi:hypothetical protein
MVRQLFGLPDQNGPLRGFRAVKMAKARAGRTIVTIAPAVEPQLHAFLGMVASDDLSNQSARAPGAPPRRT